MDVTPRLASVYEKLQAGQFLLGLEELQKLYDPKRQQDRLFMGEFLLRIGRWQESESLIRSVADNRSSQAPLVARALELLAHHSRLRGGDLPDPLNLLERSLQLATKHGIVTQICRAQIGLIWIKADVLGNDALGSLLSEARWNVMRSGDPHLFLWLHLRFAEIEAKKGNVAQAERHLQLTSSLLSQHQDLWVEARLQLLRSVFAEPSSDLQAATNHLKRALELARESGAIFEQAAALSNLGHLAILGTKYDKARGYLSEARNLAIELPLLRTAIFDSLAFIELQNDRFDESETYLREAEVSRQGTRYADIEKNLTLVRLLRRRGRLEHALALATESVGLADERRVNVLAVKFRVLQADILLDLDRTDDAKSVIKKIDTPKIAASLTLLAEVERLSGRISVRVGMSSIARIHFERAKRIFITLGHVVYHDETEAEAARDLSRFGSDGVNKIEMISAHSSTVEQFISSVRLVQFACNPILLGREAMQIAQALGATRMALVLTNDRQRRELVDHQDWPTDGRSLPIANIRTVGLGSVDQNTYELVVESGNDDSIGERLDPVLELIAHAVELHEARQERGELTSLWPTVGALSDSGSLFYGEKMQEVRKQALRLAPTDLKVLITGETGVGKEVVARLIHDASKRAGKNFEAVNCASVPRDLFEAHLFGHRKGAFTGAVSDQPGVIRGNDGGTIFFDEIGELSIEMQVKLLRVLDSSHVHPIGAPNALPVDFRAIAATNANLHEMLEQKRFREDLFYRLNVATLRVPPLRERREEILPFVDHFLAVFCTRNNRPLLRVSDEAKEYLVLYNWPGNIRELRNEVERLCGMLEVNDVVRPKHLAAAILRARKERLDAAVEAGPNEVLINIDQPLASAYAEIDRYAIVAALKRAPNDLDASSKRLGLTRKGLYNKRLRFGML
jgi:DNA-binding NtrC family response regulator